MSAYQRIAPPDYATWPLSRKNAWAEEGARLYREKAAESSALRIRDVGAQHVYDPTSIVKNEAPRPLRRETPESEPFPVEALGPALAPAARAINDRVRCGDAIAGMGVLAAAAFVCQAHVDVMHPLAKRARPISLFLVTVAGTGERKSAADAEALAPIRAREAELRETYDRDILEFQRDRRAYDAAQKKAEKSGGGEFQKVRAALEALGPEPVPPLLPIMRATEPTFEGLCKLFRDGRPSLALFADEGGSFIGGHAMTAEAKLRTITGLSSLWDGAPINRIRAGDGATVMPGRRLSAHLMCQPGVAAELLADEVSKDQGFLSRILVSAPCSNAGTRFHREEAKSTARTLENYQTRMLSLLRQDEPLAHGTRNELAPRVLYLDTQARDLWFRFHDVTEAAIGPGGHLEPVRGLANKLAEHALRIAAVLACFENINAESIGFDHMKNAAVLADHFAEEALRTWGAGAVSAEIGRAEQLLTWLHARPEPVIALKTIYQKGPSSIRVAATARQTMGVLEDHGWAVRLGPHAVAGETVREAWRIVREV